MSKRRLLFSTSSLLAALLLSACARMIQVPPTAPRPETPRPAPEVTTEPGAAAPAPKAVIPEPEVVTPKKRPPPPSPPAVVALMEEADEAGIAGQWDNSAATLERAIRIQPRNPVLWHRLAKARLQQGQWQSAEDLAKKSNVFAGRDSTLVTENWLLIADARRRRGDSAGAKDAEARAAR